MFVYFVMSAKKVHCKNCKEFNAQYEHVRVHVRGVFLSKTRAKLEAKSLSTLENKCFVTGYKIKDPEVFKIQLGLSVLEPLVLWGDNIE